MYNSLGEYPITNDLFIEFIQDAKKKSGLYLEYEIEYGGSDMQSKKLVSKGSTKNNENISSVVKKPKYSWWYYIKNGGKKAVERRDEAIKEGINQAEDDR